MTENKPVSDEPVSSGTQPISLQPFAIQLQDVFAIEIIAKRFPVDNSSDTQINTNINIVGLNIDPASFQAQVIIEVKLEPLQEPHLFEIFLRMVGLFSYAAEYDQNLVQQFLQQGSLSVMLPFVRELIFSLSTRIQIPPIMLSLIQLAPSAELIKRNDTGEVTQKENIQPIEEK
jgi:preprotein translocase subunit SecB